MYSLQKTYPPTAKNLGCSAAAAATSPKKYSTSYGVATERLYYAIVSYNDVRTGSGCTYPVVRNALLALLSLVASTLALDSEPRLESLVV